MIEANRHIIKKLQLESKNDRYRDNKRTAKILLLF